MPSEFITASDIGKLSDWLLKRWPSSAPIDPIEWLDAFSRTHQPRHFEYACRVFSGMAEAPTIQTFGLACLMIGQPYPTARSIIPEGMKAWRGYWKELHAGHDKAMARDLKKSEAAQSSLF